MTNHPTAVDRFSGFAARYDSGRPEPPAELAGLLSQYAGAARPQVVDLGAGTGLSTSVWEGRATRVVAVEPSPDMRQALERRLASWRTAHQVRSGSAEDTGLPDAAADVVTAGQAMHWFDPERALTEIARILRPGGVFCAFDYDWPPLTDAEVDAAFFAADRRYRALEEERGLVPRRAPKAGHLGRMRDSGLFRSTREVALHRQSRGGPDDFMALVGTQGGVVALRRAGCTEADLGLDELRRVAEARLAPSTVFWWTYRLRLAWK
ncbi:MAG: methyltransferase domain-containing protein [Candidatus Dormibacteraeota bacterium]|nr:methyltransferase domain-containing protein [Candidatus Dormibacteraeota bacterium]